MKLGHCVKINKVELYAEASNGMPPPALNLSACKALGMQLPVDL